MPKTTKTNRTELAIQELEWALQGSEGHIETTWLRVERAQMYATDSQKSLNEAIEQHTEAVNRKEGIRYALTVLRNHEES